MWKAKLRTSAFILSIVKNHSKVLNKGMEYDDLSKWITLADVWNLEKENS